MLSIKTCLSTKHGQGTLLGDEDIMVNKADSADPVLSSRNHMGVTLRKMGLGEEVSTGFGLHELNAIEKRWNKYPIFSGRHRKIKLRPTTKIWERKIPAL